ncbi:MAG: hypothetical protein HYZ21_13435 [Chloroflexi bacterium]|nr:hypothetical protein [Chloroflexota bacterium]
MKHPLEFVSMNLRKPIFYFFLALTITIFGVFSFLDQPLQTSAAPSGIVSFELARTLDASQTIVNSWDSNARLTAAFGLGFDYLFMPVYALALSLGLLLAGNGKSNWYQSLTIWLGWGAFAAAFFDAVENYTLWQLLTGNADSLFPRIAAVCATIKFTILITGILIALASKAVRE